MVLLGKQKVQVTEGTEERGCNLAPCHHRMVAAGKQYYMCDVISPVWEGVLVGQW